MLLPVRHDLVSRGGLHTLRGAAHSMGERGVLPQGGSQQLFFGRRRPAAEMKVDVAADDALAVAPLLDALLLVVAEGQSERSDILDSRHLLESFNVIGTVLNKSVDKDSKRKSYNY